MFINPSKPNNIVTGLFIYFLYYSDLSRGSQFFQKIKILFTHYYNFRGRHGALQCRMVAAEYSQSQFNQWTQFPNQYNVQFGGASTQNVKPASCRTGYTAVGHMCLILPAKDAAFYTDGKLECSNLGATMYAPESTTQNSLMAVYLEQEVMILIFNKGPSINDVTHSWGRVDLPKGDITT